MDELMYDKKNGNVAFRESDHVYFDLRDPNKKYLSVTTCISNYIEKFDSYFWSRYKALEALLGLEIFSSSGVKSTLLDRKVWNDNYATKLGVDPIEVHAKGGEIEEGYRKNSEAACAYGTAYHLEQELKFYKAENKFSIASFDKRFTKEYVCIKDHYELDIENGIYPEYLIYWEEDNLRISGQIDLLIKEGNDIYLIDYKTNAKGIEDRSYYNHKTKSYKMMKYPVNGLMDCDKMHYTLQLSFYAKLLQKINPDFQIKLLLLKHCSRDGVETDIELEYMPGEVEKIIKDVKKKNYIEEERNKSR